MAYDKENRHFSQEIDRGGRNVAASLLTWLVAPTTLFILPMLFAFRLWDGEPAWSQPAAIYFGVSGILLGLWSLYLCGVPGLGGRWTSWMPVFFIITYTLALIAAYAAFGWVGVMILVGFALLATLSLLGALG